MKMNAQYHGLTEAEARRLREMGGGNTPPPPITKSTGQIIRENVCTLFNLFNLLIAAALALVGAWSNRHWNCPGAPRQEAGGADCRADRPKGPRPAGW